MLDRQRELRLAHPIVNRLARIQLVRQLFGRATVEDECDECSTFADNDRVKPSGAP